MIINGYKIEPRTDLSGANLRGANLSSADLSGANLSSANLYGADLSGANLSGADLYGANLSSASLRGANLRGSDLYGANLSGANLSGVSLYGANLSGASLSGASLSGANLRCANLSGASLYGANLSGANLSGATNIPNLYETIIVPEGDLIVYKKVSNGIAKLLIPKDAKRSNGTGRKCRAEKAVVLECPDGAVSLYDISFTYSKGKTITPKTPFDPDRWIECSSGIHFFLTREEAEAY